ncbi:PQQ-binding-like beta-propeller repeat protein [Streptomyces sp. NPDC001787]|uniref:serine/threonine-protein kinase n=1 Tax=Streptomyces sp. NPDC001787 TaxID=3154523 RepID=UPI003332F50A
MFSPLTHDDPHSLGGHRPLARLGSGGMGTVYLARSGGGRTVALKTMHARIASDPAFRTRFRLETEAARVIGPVHGARVFEADPAAETPWLATEYVLGPPLDEAVRLAGPLPETAVRALGALLCAALTQLHLSGVVHRDLKPSNIMLTADGPKVIDFGIARALGDERLTRTGAAAGTPAYMSPEQATGQEHTSAGDVFALAGVLTWAASGHGPFGSGLPADLLYRVRYTTPDLTGVPAALVPVLARCLSKDPAGRPTTTALADELAPPAGEFADQLPEPLLMEMARRAAAVWAVTPHRLPPPAGHEHEHGHGPALAGTAVDGAGPGMSRRRVLALGGAGLLGAAGVAAGARYLTGADDDGPEKGAAGQNPSKGPASDQLWQVRADYGISPRVPPAPLLLEELVVVADSASTLQALDPRTGKARWTDLDTYRFHQVTSDGEQIYAIEFPFEETDPLTIGTVGLGDGKLTTPFARLPDLRGRFFENQLLCVADGTLYAVGGRGPYSTDGFLKAQTWSLLALDSRTGATRWSQPLPARPDGSEPLHFLTAQVRGRYLVLVQQSAKGGISLAVRDTRTGRRLWSRPLDGDGPAFTRARFAVDDRHVYTGSGALLALRLADGAQAWRYARGSAGAAYGPPAVEGGVVYAVEQDRGVVAVGAGDGKPRWTEKGRADTGTVLDVAPAVSGGRVYSASASGLTVTDARTSVSSRPYRAAVGRYFPHEGSGTLIALGDAYAAAYPLG